jgi:hypothetical protein
LKILVKSKRKTILRGGLVNAMAGQESRKVWKVRTVKNYPDAHNHILVGQVLDLANSYLSLDCRTYHFGRSVNGPKEVRVGSRSVRDVPWSRIEIINELSASFGFADATLVSEDGSKILLTDGNHKYVLTSSYDTRY